MNDYTMRVYSTGGSFVIVVYKWWTGKAGRFGARVYRRYLDPKTPTEKLIAAVERVRDRFPGVAVTWSVGGRERDI